MSFKDRLSLNLSRRRLLRAMAATAVAPLGLAAVQSTTAEAASPRIEFRIVRAGFIVGASSGSGTLRFDGNRYRLRIGGVSLGATFGAASAEFVGRVRNLRKASDIQGNYTAVNAGVARLRNSRGVELEVSGKQVGLMASVDLSGIRIRLER